VDENFTVREEFLGFCECTSEALTEDKKLEKNWELNMDTFCGQGYDGAGSMVGKRRGIAARIMNKYPKALYTHCVSHILNLCIVEATSIIDVR